MRGRYLQIPVVQGGYLQIPVVRGRYLQISIVRGGYLQISSGKPGIPWIHRKIWYGLQVEVVPLKSIRRKLTVVYIQNMHMASVTCLLTMYFEVCVQVELARAARVQKCSLMKRRTSCGIHECLGQRVQKACYEQYSF